MVTYRREKFLPSGGGEHPMAGQSILGCRPHTARFVNTFYWNTTIPNHFSTVWWFCTMAKPSIATETLWHSIYNTT